MKNITTLGIDLAKNVFQLHGADSRGKAVLRKQLSRAKLIEFIAKLKPCLIGIEACCGAHYWARKFKELGHTVKMMSPQFVKPYVKSNKNDRNDAAAIAEAVTRPEMKFVPIKTVEQQDALLAHRARELLIKQRTAQSNQIRGFLLENGIAIAKGHKQIRELPKILADYEDKLTARAKFVFDKLHENFKEIEQKIEEFENQIKAHTKSDSRCKALMEIEGVGPITASAAVATIIGDANAFKNGREVSAWLGIVPKQHSSGNKTRLLGISKRGDGYLRKLLIHGARSVIKVCEKKVDKRSLWIADKKQRCGANKASVALANKNARIIWAILANGEYYRKAA